MAKGKRFVVFVQLTETKEWQEAAQYETRKGAIEYVRNNLIGLDGASVARVHDSTGEEVDREISCIPHPAKAKAAA